MELWVSAILFAVCASGAVVSIKFYGKSRKKYFLFLTAAVSVLGLALLIYSCLTFVLLGGVKNEDFIKIDTYIDETIASESEPESSDISNAEIINAEDALTLLNDTLADQLAERGIDIAVPGLTLYYDEPKRVETEDYSGYVEAWIFLHEQLLFYAVTVDGSQVSGYDLINGQLYSLDEMLEAWLTGEE